MNPYLSTRVTVDANGCWLWNLSLNHHGYAQGKPPGGKYRSIHRFAYETAHGPIPEGLQLDHLCRVRHCVNPDHLEPVTSHENSHRSSITIASRNAAKTHCKQGHEFTDVNTYIAASGSRVCRTCQASVPRAHYARQKASA